MIHLTEYAQLWTKTLRSALFVFFCLILAPIPAKAHPHVWIDLESNLVFSEDGSIEGLQMSWLFDDFYSVLAIDHMDQNKDGEPDPEVTQEMVDLMFKDLKDYSYFTFFNVDGYTPSYGTPKMISSEIIGHRWMLSFMLPLEDKIDPRTMNISYAVYDPTYYVEVLHTRQDNPIQLTGTKSQGCGYELKAPEPSEELSLFAAALDQTETAGDGLGQYFAEWVTVSCE